MTDEKAIVETQETENTNIENVFDEEEEGTETPEEKPAKKEPESEKRTGDKSDSQEENETPETPSDEKEEDEEDEEKSVPVAALKSERQKRQAAEAKLAELEKKLTPAEENEQEVPKEIFDARAVLSREILTSTKGYEDYEKMEDVFAELAKKDISLKIKLRQSQNPAMFAYETAKQHLEIQSLKEMKESPEYAEFQKWKSEKAKTKTDEETPAEKRKKAALDVPNLNQATSVNSNSTPREKIIESPDELFPD